MSRIVLTTIGSFGDLHPKIAIAIELRKRGHDVVLATHKEYQKKIEAKKLRELENPSYAAKAAEIGRFISAENGVEVACDAIEKHLQAVI